jgi:hypothetical protein
MDTTAMPFGSPLIRVFDLAGTTVGRGTVILRTSDDPLRVY